MLQCIAIYLLVTVVFGQESQENLSLFPYKIVFLSSPGFPGGHSAGSHHVWKFSAEKDPLKIQFLCDHFNVGDSQLGRCSSGHLKVNNKLFCGVDKVKEEFLAKEFEVEFKTKNSAETDKSLGFQCSVVAFPHFKILDARNDGPSNLRDGLSPRIDISGPLLNMLARDKALRNKISVDQIKDNHVRIVNGKPETNHECPYQAVIKLFGSTYCGATIISKKFLVTAAHCMQNGYQNRMSIHLGNSLSKIKNVIIHPKFNKNLKQNDIALIELNKPVELSDSVKYACLPNENKTGKDIEYKKLIVSGAGSTSYMGSVSKNVRFAELVGVPYDECKSYDILKKILHPSMICAYAEKKDACQGDSGGPLVSKEEDCYVLWGVVSFGLECATYLPGIYSNVAMFVPWIRSHIPDVTYGP